MRASIVGSQAHLDLGCATSSTQPNACLQTAAQVEPCHARAQMLWIQVSIAKDPKTCESSALCFLDSVALSPDIDSTNSVMPFVPGDNLTVYIARDAAKGDITPATVTKIEIAQGKGPKWIEMVQLSFSDGSVQVSSTRLVLRERYHRILS